MAKCCLQHLSLQGSSQRMFKTPKIGDQISTNPPSTCGQKHSKPKNHQCASNKDYKQNVCKCTLQTWNMANSIKISNQCLKNRSVVKNMGQTLSLSSKARSKKQNQLQTQLKRWIVNKIARKQVPICSKPGHDRNSRLKTPKNSRLSELWAKIDLQRKKSGQTGSFLALVIRGTRWSSVGGIWGSSVELSGARWSSVGARWELGGALFGWEMVVFIKFGGLRAFFFLKRGDFGVRVFFLK